MGLDFGIMNAFKSTYNFSLLAYALHAIFAVGAADRTTIVKLHALKYYVSLLRLVLNRLLCQNYPCTISGNSDEYAPYPLLVPVLC